MITITFVVWSSLSTLERITDASYIVFIHRTKRFWTNSSTKLGFITYKLPSLKSHSIWRMVYVLYTIKLWNQIRNWLPVVCSIRGPKRWQKPADPYLHWSFVMVSKRISWQMWENFWTAKSGILFLVFLIDVVCICGADCKPLFTFVLSGYLLYGKPGTGKTSTIHAIVMFSSPSYSVVYRIIDSLGWGTRFGGIISILLAR